MGQSSVKLSKTEVQLVDQKKYIREPITPNDERYGQKVRIYKQINSSERIAIIEKIYDTQMLYQANLDMQRVLTQLKHPGLIQLLNVATKTKEKLCSNFFKIKLLYEYVNNDLQKDMQLRLQSEKDLKYLPQYQLTEFEDLKVNDNYKIHYEESELWYIIATVVAVLAYLQERNLIHGDIRPYNLCLTNNNILKVMTINSYIQTNWTSYMEKLQKIETVSTYISPIQLGALQHNIQQPNHNVHKSDIFCLGVIILELCLLESAQDIYDFSSYSIDLTKRIKSVRALNKYSEVFVQTLIQMLNLQEKQRTTPEQIYDKISQLAQAQEIVVSNRISSLERVLLVVNKWKIQNQQNQNNVVVNQGVNNNKAQIQQQGYINPENIFDQQQQPQQHQQQQQQNTNQSQDEIPNQDDGEIVQELGLLNKSNNKQTNYQKNHLNTSPDQKQGDESNRNNISILSGIGGYQSNKSQNQMNRDLSGDLFRRNDNNKENQLFPSSQNQQQIDYQTNTQNAFQRNQSQSLLNALIAATGQNNAGMFNQQSQFQNNQNMNLSTGTFGGQLSNINNNSLFGLQNNNQNNNINNQQNLNNNVNTQLMYQLLNLMNQNNMNKQQNMNNYNLQNNMKDPQFNQMFLQLQQIMQNNNNNNMSLTNLPPLVDQHSFGQKNNTVNNNYNQMNMNQKFNMNSNQNLSMNRIGGLNQNYQNPNQQNIFSISNNNMGQATAFGNNVQPGGFQAGSNSLSLQLQNQLNSFQGGNANIQGNSGNMFQQQGGNLVRGNTKTFQNGSTLTNFNQNSIHEGGYANQVQNQIGSQNNVHSNSLILANGLQSSTNTFGRNKNIFQ